MTIFRQLLANLLCALTRQFYGLGVAKIQHDSQQWAHKQTKVYTTDRRRCYVACFFVRHWNSARSSNFLVCVVCFLQTVNSSSTTQKSHTKSSAKNNKFSMPKTSSKKLHSAIDDEDLWSVSCWTGLLSTSSSTQIAISCLWNPRSISTVVCVGR